MKLKLVIFFFILNGFLIAQQNQLTWHTNLTEASQLAIKTGKPIFAFFTGSDWCGWCVRLQKSVFEKEAFITWAQKNVVLLELDFPRRKQLSPELTQQNNQLQQNFQVTGYPTVWLFKPTHDVKTNQLQITALGKLGYPAGAAQGQEAEKFLETANGILNIKSK
ncbi:MAG TPA: thioredoxin family protein [Bacteroidia bacterium]|jgi:thioredoxin-related protein|nr:thioredoxin family protein [Bacteroidia bacterium]